MARKKKQDDMFEDIRVAARLAQAVNKLFSGEDTITYINAEHLQQGQKFRELGDSNGKQPGTVLESAKPLCGDHNCVHVKTSRGTWCIARGQQLILV